MQDILKLKAKGELEDTIVNKKTGEVIVIKDHNIIVTDVLLLVTSLLKNHTGYSGMTYWENGSGDEAWDTTMVDPTDDLHALVAPLYRSAIPAVNIIWIDDDDVESLVPTNRLQITQVFASAESNGELREVAIWGGDANGTIGTGIMINTKRHGVITKDEDMELTRRLRITFSLSES